MFIQKTMFGYTYEEFQNSSLLEIVFWWQTEKILMWKVNAVSISMAQQLMAESHFHKNSIEYTFIYHNNWQKYLPKEQSYLQAIRESYQRYH